MLRKKNHVDLLLIEEKSERLYVLIKDLKTFMYDQTLHRGRNYFCHYCLQALSAEEILIFQVKDYLKINGKQLIKMPKNGEYIKLKNFKRKRK